MKAIVYTHYGPPEVLKLKEVEKPIPKSGEILIKIHATAVSSGDVHRRKAEPTAVRLFFGLLKPRKTILGFALAGEIEDVGKDVTGFKIGDGVYGTTGMKFGAYAEYVSLPENATLAIMPNNLSYEQAAAIPFGGTTALHFLQKGKVQPGQNILIYGASGAVGTAAVQIAVYFGAEVTGVCSTAHLKTVQALGASKVIDYTETDFTRNQERYDVIFDTVGKSSYSGCIRSLKETGILLMCAAGPSQMIQGAWTSLTSKKKVISGIAKTNAEDIMLLRKLAEAGQLTAVIDKTYPLEQIADAHAYVEKGHKTGNVVISVSK